MRWAQAKPNKSVSFIAFGDTGEGNASQYQVSRAIQSVCQERGCDFAMGLGDNFYDGTPDYPYSPLFEEKFEQPYANLDLPFYMILGNHDTGRFSDGDGGDQALGDVQVAYHYRTDRASDKWQMPARYYNFAFPVNDGQPLVEFFAIDSAPFVGIIDPNDKYDVDVYADKQGAWLNQVMASSRADWKFAFGHHPYISNGKHGNASNYDRAIPGGLLLDKVSGLLYRNFMEEYLCNKVDMYFSGHDHNLQALKPVGPCGKTEFIVSGAGAKANAFEKINDNLVHYQKDQIPGFFYISVKGNQLTMAVYVINTANDGYTKIFEKLLKRKL
ncbi:MAG: metallophosphoesterase [Pseudomonadota bacterium]